MGAPVPFYRTLVWFLTLVELQPLPSLYPQEPEKKKTTFSDQTRVEGMTLYKRPSSLCSCYFTSHSSRALWARVWLVGCFHWFSCFFCCSIQPWRHCKRLSLSAQVRWICSVPQIWWEKYKLWMNHNKHKSHEKLYLYSRVGVKNGFSCSCCCKVK